jgi:2,5-diketo-D-gluconate reductase A
MRKMTGPTSVDLAGGGSMPRMGLGTWPLVGHAAQASVESGIAAGFRLIDTARKYENEDAVGRALAASSVARSDLFVVSKIQGRMQRKPGFVRPAIEASLSSLGLDYLDLYLIHWPLPRVGRYPEVFVEMAAAVEQGLVLNIGVSNFKIAHLDRLQAESGLTPAVNQIQLDPSLGRVQTRRAHADRGIVTQSWSPLGRGGPLLSTPVINELAAQLEISPAQVVLRWHLDHNVVPVVKSADQSRQAENLAAMDLPPLPSHALASLDALDEGESAARDSDVIEEF